MKWSDWGEKSWRRRGKGRGWGKARKGKMPTDDVLFALICGAVSCVCKTVLNLPC